MLIKQKDNEVFPLLLRNEEQSFNEKDLRRFFFFAVIGFLIPTLLLTSKYIVTDIVSSKQKNSLLNEYHELTNDHCFCIYNDFNTGCIKLSDNFELDINTIRKKYFEKGYFDKYELLAATKEFIFIGQKYQNNYVVYKYNYLVDSCDVVSKIKNGDYGIQNTDLTCYIFPDLTITSYYVGLDLTNNHLTYHIGNEIDVENSYYRKTYLGNDGIYYKHNNADCFLSSTLFNNRFLSFANNWDFHNIYYKVFNDESIYFCFIRDTDYFDATLVMDYNPTTKESTKYQLFPSKAMSFTNRTNLISIVGD